jgi:hypothetical protein
MFCFCVEYANQHLSWSFVTQRKLDQVDCAKYVMLGGVLMHTPYNYELVPGMSHYPIILVSHYCNFFAFQLNIVWNCSIPPRTVQYLD